MENSEADVFVQQCISECISLLLFIYTLFVVTTHTHIWSSEQTAGDGDPAR